MAEILLVNPRRRRRRASRKGRMPAALRRYWASRRSGKKVHRRHARIANPRRRVHRTRYRSNPSFGGVSVGSAMRSFVPTVKSGAIGAVGALANDLLYGYTKSYLPSVMTTGNAAYATKALYAVVAGMLGNMVLRGKGRDLSIGAMTVVIHDAAKPILQASIPSLPLGEYLAVGPSVGYSGVRRLPSSTYRAMSGMGRMGRMGQYMSGMRGLGDTNYENGIPTG